MPSLREKISRLPLVQADIQAAMRQNGLDTPIATAAEALAVLQEAIDKFWDFTKVPPDDDRQVYDALLGVGASCCGAIRDICGIEPLPAAVNLSAEMLTSGSERPIHTLHDAYGRIALRMDALRLEARAAMRGGQHRVRAEAQDILALVFLTAVDLDLIPAGIDTAAAAA